MANYPSYTQNQTPAGSASASVTINPYATTNMEGTFNVDAVGSHQGIAQAGPAYRYELSPGYVASTEQKPMYGGLPIVATIAQSRGAKTRLRRATTTAEITGFSVLNDCPNLIVTAGSSCPSIGGNGTINFYRLGSRAKIPLPIDPALIDLVGKVEPQALAWDFTKNMLIASSSGAGGQSLSSGSSSDSSSKATKSSSSVQAQADTGNLNVVIREICPYGWLAGDDGKGNLNWVRTENDTAGRYLAIIQI